MESKLKLPGSSFEEVSKIIQAYAFANKVVSLEDVSKRIGMHATVISRNNGFLVSIGILEGGRNKGITPLGKKLGDAISHGLDEEVTSILHQIVEDTDFLKNVVSAVRIRRGMDEPSLKAHIAYSAGQAKSQGVMTGTGAIVELLKRSGHLEEVDGKLTAAAAQSVQQETTPGSSAAAAATTASTGQLPRIFYGGGGTSGTSINLSIEVRIDCKPGELDGLGSKLRELISQFENVDKKSPDEQD